MCLSWSNWAFLLIVWVMPYLTYFVGGRCTMVVVGGGGAFVDGVRL